MKKIEAIINPSKLEIVVKRLNDSGFCGMTVTQVIGYGRQKGHKEIYRGAEYTVDFVPKIKIETVVKAERVKEAVEIIMSSANNNKIGDGKIFVIPVNEAVRIRTGEVGNDVL